MRKLITILLALALLPALALAEGGAEGVMDLLGAKDFDALYEMCDDTMKGQLGGADALATVWEQAEASFGAYQSYTSIAPMSVSGYDAYSVECDFEKATASLVVALDSDGKLAGLSVATFSMKSAEAADEGEYVEEEIALRAGEENETKGMLTLPEGEGPFPCVIMMQGSGPSDMNETAFGIPVFQELARALAGAGVASIRYDKYTYAHADLIASNYEEFTVDGEYTLDAKDAAALLDSDSRISSIYLLGHSEGALVAPRVAAQIESAKLSGMVLLAGSPKPLYEILLRQLKDAGTAEAELTGYQDQFAAMANMTAEELQNTQLLGAPMYYWQDQADYDYAAKIAELGLPVFVAQGAKDFQVLPSEGIEAYQAALSRYDKATYKLYDDMTHLLHDLSGDSTGTAADYTNLGDRNADLVPDLAQWILAQ